jgi:dihydrodipicolinate reductase
VKVWYIVSPQLPVEASAPAVNAAGDEARKNKLPLIVHATGLAEAKVALRAGASPGMHLVGFDAPGESIELRVTARDRSAYVAGALLAADTLLAQPDRFPGVTTFEQLLTDLTTDTTDITDEGAPR